MSRIYIPTKGWVESVSEQFDFEFKNIRKEDEGFVRNRRRIEDSRHLIETMLNGAINYYKTFQNIGPADEGKIEQMENYSKYLVNKLASFKDFK